METDLQTTFTGVAALAIFAVMLAAYGAVIGAVIAVAYYTLRFLGVL
jgi:hypothetical protein